MRGIDVLGNVFLRVSEHRIFPKLALANGVLKVLVIGPWSTSDKRRGLGALAGRLFLLTGCGLGACYLRHSQIKQMFAPLLTVTLNGFGRFYIKNLSGDPGASGFLLSASWVPPG